MLTDTGPMVAIIDEGDAEHARCMAVLATLPRGPLVTTWPCFAEAMYLLDSVGGYRFPDRLWRWRRDGRLVVLDLSGSEVQSMDSMMERYKNVPMDLADASLVAVARSRNYGRVFTLDSDFHIYRLSNRAVLEVVP